MGKGPNFGPWGHKKKIPGLYTVVENPLVGSLLKNFIFGKYLMSFCHSVKHIKINLASIGIQQYCSYYILSRKQILTGSRRRSTFCSCLLVKVRHIILYNWQFILHTIYISCPPCLTGWFLKEMATLFNSFLQQLAVNLVHWFRLQYSWPSLWNSS